MTSPLVGNAFALGGATVWAISSLLFAKTRLSPYALNFGKNTVALLAFLATLAWLTRGTPMFRADLSIVATLAVSSLIGLVLGDWCHFRALRLLGPRKALVLETFAPVFAAAIAFAWRGETLTPVQLAGIAATVFGVVLVVGEAHGVERSSTSRERWVGGAFGVLAALGQASGATLSKIAIVALESSPDAPAHAALEASTWRLIVAAAFGVGIAAFARGPRHEASEIVTRRQWPILVPAALLATYAGVWCSLLAFQHAPVAVASTLLALSPVLILPLARWLLNERLSARAIVGALISVAGCAALFWET